jgi:hypothetical protein
MAVGAESTALKAQPSLLQLHVSSPAASVGPHRPVEPAAARESKTATQKLSESRCVPANESYSYLLNPRLNYVN